MHVIEQLTNALKDALYKRTDAGQHVYADRFNPVEDEQLPNIEIEYLSDQPSDFEMLNARTRDFVFQIIIRVKDADGATPKALDIRSQIENELSLCGLDVDGVNIPIDLLDATHEREHAEQPVVKHTLEYSLMASYNDPEAII